MYVRYLPPSPWISQIDTEKRPFINHSDSGFFLNNVSGVSASASYRFQFFKPRFKIHVMTTGYAVHHLSLCASEDSVSVVFHCKEFLASLFRFNSVSDKRGELLYAAIATTSYFTVLQSLLNQLLLICSRLKMV